MQLRSPAKINLFLHILGRRPDGYHELASLFQAVDLCDTLHFTLGEIENFSCSDSTLPLDGSNLVLKALRLFRNKTGLSFRVSIHLDKKIPHQAGLGGGSSNAATTLWALNELLRRPATAIQLQQWASEIGSDVPFFLSQGTAFCTGRGESVTPLPPLSPQQFWVVKPSQGTSTPLVYGKLDLKQLPQRNPEQCLKEIFSGKPNYFNDLEEAAFQVTPQLGSIKQQLVQQGYSPIMLCGSGSSFFCFGKNEAPEISGCVSFAVQFINRPEGGWY